MYHRLDGKLVAVGLIDILENMLISDYFIYDTDYKFLNLGVIGAIRELEYMALLREKMNSSIRWYSLGEMNVMCPKVNYKILYQPGVVLCPRTNFEVPVSNVLETIQLLSQISLEEKKL